MKIRSHAGDSPARSVDPPDIRPWLDVAGAARRDLTAGLEPDVSAPLGFSTRIVAQWIERRREEASWLWQRWSFRAAALSVVIALLAVVADRTPNIPRKEEGSLLPFPQLDVPLPTDSPS